MSTIPNVSSVYRDLAHIYTNTGLMSKSNEPISYHLDQKVANEKTSFEQLYSYKQKRHNQLMARLHNSSQEHKNIVGDFSSPLNQSYGYNQYEKNNMTSKLHQKKPPQYSSTNFSDQYSVNRSQKIGNFVMPKIKYRHIEDLKNNNQIRHHPHDQSSSPNKQTGNVELQKEFYQDMGTSNQNKIKNNMGKQQKQRFTIGITQPRSRNNFVANQVGQEDMRSQISNQTNGFVRSSKNEKYQDKIQSYYELCRKNLANKPNSNQSSKQQKFIRGNQNKNKAMKLDEAIKLLSID